MKKFFLVISVFLFICGCTPQEKNKQILAKINNYEVSAHEFEQEFQDSAYSRTDTLEARKEFLNLLINQKLILQDAQAKGLDRNASFLKMIEKFWEQSLLKLVLDKKSAEISKTLRTTDRESAREQGEKIMDDWIDSLHKNAKIKINYDLLKQEK